MSADNNILHWSTLPEGQFFDRKSAFDRSGSRPKHRKARDIAWDIVETLSAMADADGGELIVGIEDDGTVTGVPHPEDKVHLFLRAPRDRNYVEPALRCEVREMHVSGGLLLLHFSVDWSPEVHRLADSRTLLRVGDANTPVSANQIAALKQTKGQGLYERSFPPGATLSDIDMGLVATMMRRIPTKESPEAFLRKHRLIEGRNGRSVPCLAGLILFGRDPLRWHPRCGVDFVRWEGATRKHGAQLNVTKRLRIEHPLALLIEKTYETIRPFIRERQQLHDLFFTERLEYPAFVWQETIVNAVAHRDYGIQGASIEIWMFDDRMEVRSPGLPPRPVTVEALNRKEPIHLSRNPLIVRVLADLGYMRELGEGVPRMFDEMEREGFYPPRFEDIAGVSFQVALRNQPVYDESTLKWLQGFKDLDLTGDQKRLLVYAHLHNDRFTSRQYQNLVGMDIYRASSSIKDLIRKGVVRSPHKGSRIYEVIGSADVLKYIPEELSRLLQEAGKITTLTNQQVRNILGVSRGTATRYLRHWSTSGWLKFVKKGRGSRYEPTVLLNESLSKYSKR
ncbi:MAG: putative DNA binding domain-containing protein [Nitrospirae bacterium]|nr:putative DNA binding domain-containing protein [Nitrospirota bacterium]